MKIILSPAKKMVSDTDSLAPVNVPKHMDQTAEILSFMKSQSEEELKAVWKCNDKIAEQNFHRLETMDLYRGLTPAVLSYEGIAFQYMAPAVFEDRQLAYVQKHLRILSAFYGVLEPMDGVTPYRLEMQAKVGIGDAKNLYDYWGERLYRSVIDDSRVIINLASKEYAKAVIPYVKGKRQLVSCTFVKAEHGRFKTQATRAKIARGNLVRYLAERQADDLAVVKQFDLGYHYDEQASTNDNLVFVAD